MAPALPRSRASSFWISSSVNSKSYRLAFEWMREGVELFGSGTKLRGRYRIRLVEMKGKRTHPFWRDQRSNIWAGSRLYFFWFWSLVNYSAHIWPWSAASVRTFVASAVMVGLSISPLIIGQYACTTMLFSLQYLTISFCWRKGCSWEEQI